MPALDSAELGRIFRHESGRTVATLVRQFGDIDVAEEAVQEAFVLATTRWPETGVPPNPGAWITVTARNALSTACDASRHAMTATPTPRSSTSVISPSRSAP